MLDRNQRSQPASHRPGQLRPLDSQPRRIADFATLGEALDYAAQGHRGMNFHDARGTLTRAYPYSELRDDALAHARALRRAGLKQGDRVALIAETGPEFAACFFGAIYAGAVAGAAAAPDQLRRTRGLCRPAGRHADQQRPAPVPLPARAGRFRRNRRRASRGVAARDWDSLGEIEPSPPSFPLPSGRRDRLSAIFERLDPLPARRRGHPPRLARQSPRPRHRPRGRATPTAASRWLPWYHDMGLVGCMLSPVANQISVDYLKTEDFARRPLAWLDLISRNPGTSLSYSPTFGYDICSRRMSLADPRRRPLRPVALADRRQRRRHDPARRHAGVRRQLRRRRLQGQRLLPQLRPRRSDARGLADAAGRRHPARAGRGKRTCRASARRRRNGRAATARSSIAASRSRAWRSRSAAPTAQLLADRGSARSSSAAPASWSAISAIRKRPTPA